MFRPSLLAPLALAAIVSTSQAVDLESFSFNDANGTPLTAAVNTAIGGHSWSYAEEATTPGDPFSGDISTVQSGSYRVITDSSFAPGLESRFLDIDNVSSGQVYMTATFSSWNFSAYDTVTQEQFRLTFLDDDTGTSGSTVTAQVQIRRNTTTGAMELVGDAIGTSGSFDIANTAALPNTQAGPFTVVLALDKDSDSFEVFYKNGAGPSQALGLGGVSRVRNGNSIRMVTANFGVENFFPVFTEEVRLDSLVVSDSNPLTDLVKLQVDRVSGAMTLVNNSGAAVTGVTGVTLESASGSLDLTDFVNFTGTLSNGQTAPLDSMPAGAPGLWVRNPVEDIRAELTLSGGGVRTLDVDFVNNSGAKWVIGDLDFDGVIDDDDYDILVANAEDDLTGLSSALAYQAGDLNDDGFNDVLDFDIFKNDYIALYGAPAFARLVADVPEPSSALLAGLGLATFGLARRRRGRAPSAVSHQAPTPSRTMNRRRLGVALLALALFATARPAHAVIFEDFLFNDTAGTPIQNAVNSANPGNFLSADEQSHSVGVLTNGLGQLDLNGKDNDDFGTHFVDIEPAITTGVVYGVMEVTWNFQSALDTTQNEELRISLINNNPTGTEITAEFQIIRDDSNQMVINGQANGTGSSDLPNTPMFGVGLTQATKLIAVVSADLDNDTYEILYSSDAGSSFLSAGVGNMDSTRVVEAFRLGINNDFVNDNVLIDRVYVTDELPFVVDPDKLTLYVHPKSGYVSIVNESGTTFDIDHYRILSGDDSLLEGAWRSLSSQGVDAIDGPDGGSTAGDGTGETWVEAGGSDAGVLSEQFLLSSSEVSTSEVLTLGSVFDLAGDDQQLTFEYRDAVTGNVFEGDIVLAELVPGDFNNDGSVDAADYTVWRDNASGLFVGGDYTTWFNNFNATYSAATSSTASVPEPTGVVLVAFGVTAAVTRRRRGQ